MTIVQITGVCTGRRCATVPFTRTVFSTMYQRANQNRFQIFKTLVLPILLGLGMYMLLDLLIQKELITSDLLLRYLVGHPISRCTTLLFLIGVAAIVLIANNVFDQYCNYNEIGIDLRQLEKETRTGQKLPQSWAEKADVLLDQLKTFSRSKKSQYLWQRLTAALSFVKRTGSAIGIEDELKYLSDMDRDRQHHRYSLVRILIWATPMLGFLGTVLGISQALGGIQVGPDNDFQQMLNSLRGSLFVAFDTTALALALSIVLMFVQFFTDRFESQLLDIVDRRTHEELAPFYGNSTPGAPQAQAMQDVGKLILAETRQIMQQQLKLWEQSMQSSGQSLSQSVAQFQKAVEEQLCDSIKAAVVQFAEATSQSQQLVAEQLQLAREVLHELNSTQSHLEAGSEAVSQPDEGPSSEPEIRVVNFEQTRNRLKHIYRFVTKPVEHTEAA